MKRGFGRTSGERGKTPPGIFLLDRPLLCGYNISSIHEDAEQALSGWAGGALED
jgi:hypothetical protein